MQIVKQMNSFSIFDGFIFIFSTISGIKIVKYKERGNDNLIKTLDTEAKA